MIKIHDIILFVISIFFIGILISNYITNYISETKLIEANDLDYYTDLVAELGNVDADNNKDVDINRILPIAGNVNIPSKLQIHQPLTNLSIYPWSIPTDISIDPNESKIINDSVEDIANKLKKPLKISSLCYKTYPSENLKGGCRGVLTGRSNRYGNTKYGNEDDQIKCYQEQALCTGTPYKATDQELSDVFIEQTRNNEDEVKNVKNETTEFTKTMVSEYENSK